MSSIPVIAGGAAVDCKPSVIVGGAEIPIYDAYAIQNGQAVKVYQSADYKVHNLIANAVGEDGSLNIGGGNQEILYVCDITPLDGDNISVSSIILKSLSWLRTNNHGYLNFYFRGYDGAGNIVLERPVSSGQSDYTGQDLGFTLSTPINCAKIKLTIYNEYDASNIRMEFNSISAPEGCFEINGNATFELI